MRNILLEKIGSTNIDGVVIICIFAALIAFLFSASLTWRLIPFLKKMKVGQTIREEGPQSHMAKGGTPTMGGIAIIIGTIIGCLIFGPISSDILVIFFVFLAFGGLGFFDDYVKVKMKRNLGLTAKQKLLLQIVFATGLVIYQFYNSGWNTALKIPFIDVNVDLGVFYPVFVIFIIVSMVNSTNLTDGLDGLAAGVTAIVAGFFALMGAMAGLSEGSLFCSALMGACLGFLIFNKNPAKIFMGDTGSLAIGGGLAAAAILMNMELLLPIVGFVYVAEALSVIIQVVSFKTTGKRVFKMAPLHHHFELIGWSEKKVIVVFWSVTVILCVISYFA